MVNKAHINELDVNDWSDKVAKKLTPRIKKATSHPKTPQKSQQSQSHTQELLRTSPRLSQNKQTTEPLPDEISEDDESDSGYEPEGPLSEDDESDLDLVDESILFAEEEFDDSVLEDEIGSDDNSDVEVVEIRDKLKEWNANVIKIAKQLQIEAGSCSLPGQETHPSQQAGNESNDLESDYAESEDEHIPGSRRKSTVPEVNERSNFLNFKWCVGIKFANTQQFRDCVAKYAVAQGRDLKFDLSDTKNRRLRVRCVKGCPFKLYGSWDHTLAVFIIKSVEPDHTCHRTMESNRQMKTTWVAKQFLDVFKTRPHWPASEIVETVRRAYRVIIKKGFAYKVKYHAHRMLHGSMKEHYSKIGSYLLALQKGDEMKLLFWNCAKSYNEADYNDALEKMREVDPEAADAFVACNPTLFCRAFINIKTKNEVIVNNMAETFNAYIINARTKHVIYMLEEIRCSLMQRMVNKRKEMETKDYLICPRVQVRLEKEKEKAAYCTIIPSSYVLFQVKHELDDLTVDLDKKTCTCRKWDLTGIPCFHGVAAIFHMRYKPEDFVDDFYKRETYLKIYEGSIIPCPGERHWPKVNQPLNPPPIKIGPGRPRKNRRRDPHEDPKRSNRLTKHGLQMTCSICKSKTHNKRKCPDKDRVVLPPPPKRGRGRPRSAPSNVSRDHGASSSQAHHDATPHPTRVGIGGRVIGSGRGGRGGNRGGGRAGETVGRRGGGRGGRSGGRRAPQGFGVLFDMLGSPYSNLPGSRSGPVSIISQNDPSAPSTQASSN